MSGRDADSRPSFARRVTAAAIVTVSLAAAGTIAVTRDQRRRTDIFAGIVEASRELDSGLLEGRLERVPLPPRRAATRASTIAPPALKQLQFQGRVEEFLEKTAIDDSTSAALRIDVAIANLLKGHPETTLELLQPLLTGTQVDTAAWTAAAAAHLELGIRKSGTRHLAWALSASDRVLEASPRSEAALYNRVAALEHLGALTAAEAAGKRYLAVDTDSEWAAAVRQRVSALGRPTTNERWPDAQQELRHAITRNDEYDVMRIVREYPENARRHGESEVLPEWASHAARGDTEAAAAALRAATAIGDALRAANGESLLADAAAAVAHSPARAKEIAKAYELYAAGRTGMRDQKDNALAARLLHDAAARFDRAGTPMALVARYYEAIALFATHDSDGSAQLTERLLATCPPRYKALRAQVLWHRQQMRSRAGRPQESLADGFAAIALFDELGETRAAMDMRNNCATVLSLVGRSDEAWRMRHEALAAASRLGTSTTTMLNSFARASVREGDFATARSFFDLVLASPGISDRLRADALLWRTVAHAALTRTTPDFQLAAKAAAAVPDPALRQEAEAEVAFAEAVALRRSAPAAAVSGFTTAINLHLEQKRLALLPLLYLERARAYRELELAENAIADLRRATDLIDSRNSSTDAASLERDSFYGTADAAFEELADVLFAQGDTEGAFAAAERARGRIIKDRVLHRGDVEPIARIQQRIRAATLLVHYTSFPDRLLIRTVDATTDISAVVPVERSRLIALRQRFTQAIASNDIPAIHEHGRALYDLVIAPIGSLTPGHTLIVVPDDATADIAYSALVARDGRHLIERHAIAIAQSASWFARTAVAEPRAAITGSDITIVADPAFDRATFPDLARLSGSMIEGRAVAALFPGAPFYSGMTATRSVVMNALQGSALTHISAHALIDTAVAARSHLVLAPEGTDNGVFYLDDIPDLDLRRSYLVVVAGCGTGVRGGGTGTLRSLALALLTAGSRNVIASLWNIDDASTAALMARFYRALGAGRNPAAALREAQLDMLRSSDRGATQVRAWSGLQLYGTGN